MEYVCMTNLKLEYRMPHMLHHSSNSSTQY